MGFFFAFFADQTACLPYLVQSCLFFLLIVFVFLAENLFSINGY